jgi:hypothetical protein
MNLARLPSLFFAIAVASACFAHVASPNVYFQGYAGPYHLLVVVRTPQMIPGIAEVEIRSDNPGIREIKITPLYIVGPGSKYPPPPDVLRPTQGDAQFFAGKIWLMESGSWQVRIEADGDQGSGVAAVPVPAAARSTLPMQKELGTLLAGLMILLVAAIVSIAGAARREAQLELAEQPSRQQTRSARLVMIGTLVVVIGALALGRLWWNSAAASTAKDMIYQPPKLQVSLTGGKIFLRIGESDWHIRRPETVMTALIPDHGHLMHLFLLRLPHMDRFYHLHPEQTDRQSFTDAPPAIAAGDYKIFADIVRASGFPDTMVADSNIPDLPGGNLTGDDSEASAGPVSETGEDRLTASLSNGARMIWERDPAPLASNRLLLLRFRVEDADGKPATDLEPYMGMAGHAVLVRSDFSVFAHIHPDGSVPMAALSLADATLGGNQNSLQTAMPGSSMPGMTMGIAPASALRLPAEVAFPYGFPRPGVYRIFVQVKRRGVVETGVFDTHVRDE